VKQAQVIWSDEALNDMEAVYDFLAEKSQTSVNVGRLTNI